MTPDITTSLPTAEEAARRAADGAGVSIRELGSIEDLEAAVAAYKKVIALAGYDSTNAQCIAAREALDALVTRT